MEEAQEKAALDLQELHCASAAAMGAVVAEAAETQAAAVAENGREALLEFAASRLWIDMDDEETLLHLRWIICCTYNTRWIDDMC